MVKQLDKNEILNEDDRIFKSWATVDIVDKQGDRIPINEFKKVMPIIMKRGGVLIDQHSNKPIGKILNFNFKEHPVYKAEALELMCQIYKDYKHDDEVWDGIKKGEKTGLSFGGLNRKLEFDYSKDEPSKILKAIEGFEFSVVDKPANQGATITEINMIAKGKEIDSLEKLQRLSDEFQNIVKSELKKREIKPEEDTTKENESSNIYKKENTTNTMEDVTKQKPMDKKPEMDEKPEDEKPMKRYDMSEEDMIKALKAKGYMVSKETKKEESEESATETPEPANESEEPAKVEEKAEVPESKPEVSSEDVAKMVKEEVAKVLKINKAADTPLVNASEVEKSEIKKFKTPSIHEVSDVIKQIEELQK